MRACTIRRTTRETDIELSLDLDGTGRFSGSSGIGFFDHMLEAFAVHSGFDLTLNMTGDLQVDCHHSIEDAGIVLGQASQRCSVTKALSRATEAFSFRWTRRSPSAPSISAAVRFLCLTVRLQTSRSVRSIAA